MTIKDPFLLSDYLRLISIFEFFKWVKFMSDKIWLSSPHIGSTEQKYLQEAFETNLIANFGPNIEGFEAGIEHYLNDNESVVTLNSGTSAIHLALILLGIKKEDLVVCQSFTFSASVNPIVYQGATPVFVDSERETWNMCPNLLEKALKDQISKGQHPKAIIVVHGYGMPCKIKEIYKIGVKYGIPVIEDAAGAIGSCVGEKKCGTFGEFGIFSFNGNKIMTTSGGGALICKDEVTKRKIIYLATQARDDAPHYQHTEIGYNYRMSNVNAGIGRGQLEVLEDRIEARRANFEFYKIALKGISAIEFLAELPGFYSNRWLTCILTSSFEMREQIRLGLEKENIETRPLWKPMHQQPIFEQCDAYVNGVSDDLFERGLCLPSGSNLTEADLRRVCTYIKKIF